MKARRGDLSGPVLAILVTLVLLAIGAAIIAYFVLLGASPQQPVVSILGTPVAYKVGADAMVNVTIVNVGSTTISVPTSSVLLNTTGITVSLDKASYGVAGGKLMLEPGRTTTLVFKLTNRWATVSERDFINAVLTIEGVGSQVITIRVLRVS